MRTTVDIPAALNMVTRKTKNTRASKPATASYQHPDAKASVRPEAGAQTRFKKRKPTAGYRYDSSLAPELQWDARNPARERGEALIAEMETALAAIRAALDEVRDGLGQVRPGNQSADELEKRLRAARAKLAALEEQPLRAGRGALAALKALSRPFLNWAGKAERLSFDVPTLPLFIHERLSTQAVLDSVARHRLDRQLGFDGFFGHPERGLPEQLMKAYEHPNSWQNRVGRI